MIEVLFSSAELLLHELLLFASIWLLIGAIDDLGIDLLWIVRRGYRKLAYYRTRPPMAAAGLPIANSPGLLAVFVPTWAESEIIGEMLANCHKSWARSGCDYRIYVGCYANDAAGIAAAGAAAAACSNICLVTLPQHGPTTKADCLNGLWQALSNDELSGGYKAKAVVLHDAEDLVHADELRIFDRLIEKNAAVQLPVIPVRSERSRWISGHYCDEFAEAHGKTMVVREAIGAALPLAGVGCAIDRALLGRIALGHGGKPFDEASLTEDYELGLRIGMMGGRTIMARMADGDDKLVGTRAYFPDTLDASVKQKTRWLTGIALAGWDRLGWQGSAAEKWMRMHDRRSILAALVLVLAYACILLAALLTIAQFAGWHEPRPLQPFLATLLSINLGILVWRLAVRAAFVAAIYGAREAFLSIPRSIVANIIAIMAARRACMLYLRHCLGAPLIWEKTVHHAVPGAGHSP